MKGQRAQRIVVKDISILAPLVKGLFVREVTKDMFESARIAECANYPYVHHITDASVLEINRPSGTHTESMPYFSGKFIFQCYIFGFYYKI